VGLEIGEVVLYVRVMGDSSTCEGTLGSITMTGGRYGLCLKLVMLQKHFFHKKFATKMDKKHTSHDHRSWLIEEDLFTKNKQTRSKRAIECLQ